MFDNEHILLTGGCGYIGSHISKLLYEKGLKVVVFDNLSTGFAESLVNDEILIVGDLGSRSDIRGVFNSYNIKSVLHLAASIVVSESVRDPCKYYRNNTINSINLFEECVNAGVENIIFSSTASVYGEVSDGVLVKEQDVAFPKSPYAQSKLMSESVLQDLCKAHKSLNSVILRYFNVAGADLGGQIGQRTANATHLIKVACQAALGVKDSFTIYGTDYSTPDGTCVRDYIHVEDLAEAHLASLDYLSQGGESLIANCGYGVGYSVKDVVNMVSKVHGSDLAYREGPRRRGDLTAVVADSSRARNILGWKPKHGSLEKIVRTSYLWERKLMMERERRYREKNVTCRFDDDIARPSKESI